MPVLLGYSPVSIEFRLGPHSGKLAIGAVEPHAARRQPVDVRRLSQRMPVAAERVVQIVGNEKQDIGAAGATNRLAQTAKDREHRGQQSNRAAAGDAAGLPVSRGWLHDLSLL